MSEQQIYLDFNGTCPLEEEVKQSISNAMDTLWENPSSQYGGGKICKAAIEQSRRSIAKMLNAAPEEIIFTSGGTEANNMAIHSALEEYYRHHDSEETHIVVEGNPPIENIPHIITTNVEHDSVSKLLKHLESKNFCRVTKIAVEKLTGAVSEFAVSEAIRPTTCLITMMLANNETGVLQPVVEVSDLLRDVNAVRSGQGHPPIRLHTDAAQVIGKLRVDVKAGGGVDYLSIAGHKFYGPRIGALYVRHGILVLPMLFGGGQEKNYRPGTENTPMIVGLGKAAEIVSEKVNNFNACMTSMRDHLETRLKEIFGNDIIINFANSQRLPNTSSVTFKLLPVPASDLLATCTHLVASTGAACHSGSYSPSAVLVACGISEHMALRTIRFSVGRLTTCLEIDTIVKELCTVTTELSVPSTSC